MYNFPDRPHPKSLSQGRRGTLRNSYSSSLALGYPVPTFITLAERAAFASNLQFWGLPELQSPPILGDLGGFGA